MRNKTKFLEERIGAERFFRRFQAIDNIDTIHRCPVVRPVPNAQSIRAAKRSARSAQVSAAAVLSNHGTKKELEQRFQTCSLSELHGGMGASFLAILSKDSQSHIPHRCTLALNSGTSTKWSGGVELDRLAVVGLSRWQADRRSFRYDDTDSCEVCIRGFSGVGILLDLPWLTDPYQPAARPHFETSS